MYIQTKTKDDVRTALQDLNALLSRDIFFLHTLTNSVVMTSSLYDLQEQNESLIETYQ